MAELNLQGETESADEHRDEQSQALDADLRKQLATLSASGADGYDPVRWRYIDSLARRAAELPAVAAQGVEQKIRSALEQYQSDFAQAREDIPVTTGRPGENYPETDGNTQCLLDGEKYFGIKRLISKLQSVRGRSSKNLDALSALSEQLLEGETPTPVFDDKAALTDFLQQQELEILASVSETSHAGKSPGKSTTKRSELKSLPRFRMSWEKIRSDNVATQVANEAPENPGPLNQHMLVIRSLTKMHDLSPQYFNRFVSYMETLRWLELALKKNAPHSPKKTSGKSKNKAKTKK